MAEKTALKAGTVVKHCSCQSAYQDQKYGPGMRVFNQAVKNQPKCTVCGRSA